MKRQMRYIHPGEILREEVIAANELTVTPAAKMLGISRQSFNKIIHEQSDITPELSFSIAMVFGRTADIWANLQTKFNLHLAAEKTKNLHLKPYYPQSVFFAEIAISINLCKPQLNRCNPQ
jgi:addiction module HigA family antidote